MHKPTLKARKDIVFVRPDSVQCDRSDCAFFKAGQPLFGDANHLAVSQLPLFRPVFEAALDRARPAGR